MPIDTACWGKSPGEVKKRALASIVEGTKSTTPVKELKSAGGSLKPTCPLAPRPNNCKSIPPAFAIKLSYSW
ncbi:hypothetical protein SDAV_001811 [Spiroplasma phoeniceum P40]|uniref:Uncharacterized protein n=1 Tax=Spiroplasma phoeniceum P40 TaxID=1276259 RepID=A0A345DRB9_9MOLU|nr:hypothetical protein SDAV_001811 [Spiroplasma phoeniceum P40]